MAVSRRAPRSQPEKKLWALLILLGAGVLLVVVLLPLLLRPDTRESTSSTAARTVPLYTDRRWGDVPGPYFEGVAQNEYDVAAFAEEDGFLTYESQGTRARVGVDVSVFQGDIDWQQVRDSGVEYAMIRAGRRGYTEGQIARDENLEQNLTGALEAGLPVGVYFFSQAVSEAEAEEEARLVLDWIRGYDITYPVVFDWEIVQEPSARTNDVSGETLTALTAAFCRVIRDAGYTPAVYAGSQLVLRGLDLSVIRDYDLWLVEYKEAPTFYYDFAMWQYTDSGAVPGIQGDVDLNLCFKIY